jgi:mannose-6-phosphate isomerase-like protein (cupin superfamily)
MSDVTIRSVDQMEAIFGGLFVRARAELGVTSFGIQVENMPANHEAYPEHNHEGDGQEEVYTVLSGSAQLQADGQSWDLTPGVFARVGANQSRKIVTTGEGCQLLAIGGTPDKAYEVAPFTELGGPIPGE